MPFVVICISLSSLSMLYGIAASQYDLLPYPLARSAWRQVKQLHKNWGLERYRYRTHREGEGVTVYDTSRAFDGVTFFTALRGDRFQGCLIDMHGNTVHEWQIRFSDVWERAPHIRDQAEDESINFRGVLQPDGSLFVLFGSGNVPPGGGLAKIDRHSNVLFKVAANCHHDMDLDDEGNIYAISHEFVAASEARIPVSSDWYLDEYILKLSPQGQLIWKLSLTEAIVESDFAGLFSVTYLDAHKLGRKRDPMHANNVELLRPALAPAFPMFGAGDILVSFRNMNAIAVIDTTTRAAKWALTGQFVRQHDPDFLPDGRLLLYDNRGHKGPGGGSRIMEIDPATQKTEWVYAGNEQHPFYSRTRGKQQRLPNGNTLITESNGGRVFEVTRDREIVWEYVNALPATAGERRVGMVQDAARFGREELTFLTDRQKPSGSGAEAP